MMFPRFRATLSAAANIVDNTNDDFSGLTFDNNVAPEIGGSFANTYLGARDQLRILFPLGILVVDNDIFTDNDGSVSWSGSIEKFHNDFFWLNSTSLRAVYSGCNWSNGDNAGRFCLNLNNDPTLSNYVLGCRCRALSPQ